MHMIYASRDSRAGRYRFIFTRHPPPHPDPPRRRGLLIPSISTVLFFLLLFLLFSLLRLRRLPASLGLKTVPRSLTAIFDSSLQAIETKRMERAGGGPGCRNSQQFCNDAMHASWEADNDI